MGIKSILKPESSVVTSLAVAGSVYAIYNLSIGSVAGAAASDANHTALESSRKKAGYTAFILVTAFGLITRDGNVTIVGFGSIAAMEIMYRHAIMSDPATGKIVSPSLSAYEPAGAVIPVSAAADSQQDTDAAGSSY